MKLHGYSTVIGMLFLRGDVFHNVLSDSDEITSKLEAMSEAAYADGYTS